LNTTQDLSGNESDDPEIAKWDPAFTALLINAVTPVIKRWFRPEVRGLETFPSTGGALLVSNHSGGVLTPDWNVLARALYGKFGYDRPLYTLAHYGVFFTPFRASLSRLGVIHAIRYVSTIRARTSCLDVLHRARRGSRRISAQSSRLITLQPFPGGGSTQEPQGVSFSGSVNTRRDSTWQSKAAAGASTMSFTR
jgi:Acyltransferase